MDKKRWYAETLMRGEKAMSDLETFWGNFKASTREGRRLMMSQLPSLRSELAGVSEADSYVLERLTKLDNACRQLSRLQPMSFSEEDQIVFALGDVSVIRGQLHMLGIVEEETAAPK